MKVTAIFDIGKSNKKFFLFDKNYKVVLKEYIHIEEIEDEDGYPTDNLPAIREWIKNTFDKIIKNKEFEIKAVNFSTYGASLIHLDKYGQPLTHLYNYTKPYPEEILEKFYKNYGSKQAIAKETASPALGMLNSGFQLYWLKETHPEVFEKVKYTLHFPQYLSYLFTGIPVSDPTSIGCHTCLWDFEKKDYHHWVYAEGIDRALAPIVPTDTSINIFYGGKRLKAGVGIHDSSSALLPYILSDSKPFLLISTGTWSISLNPFNEEPLSEEELQNDCLNYLRIDGKPVKAARLFLGNEYKIQVQKLLRQFEKKGRYHRKMKFDEQLHRKLTSPYSRKYRFESIHLPREQPIFSKMEDFTSFEEGFHQLMLELVELQVQATGRAIGHTPVKKIYIDGGFAENDVFVKLLSLHFRDKKLRTTRSPLGSALGAALVISDDGIGKKFMKRY